MAWQTKCTYVSKPQSVFNNLSTCSEGKISVDSITYITYSLLINF